MWEYNHSYPNELYHYGVKGMKWGVRRYQNKDGSYTSEGKKRRSQDPETVQKRKATAKKVAKVAAAIGVTAAAAYAVKNHPDVVGKVIRTVGGKTIKAVRNAKQETINHGKKAVKAAIAGVKEGIEEAPKKAAKAVVTGLTLNATKRFLDNTLGKEEAARIFQANEKKKISSFWKVNDSRDKDDDDDD